MSLAVLLALVLGLPERVSAEPVPPHLASLAKDLLTRAGPELDSPSGETTEDAVRTRARAILDQARVRYWASRKVVRKDAAGPIAEALGLDLSKAEDWHALHGILSETDRDAQLAALRRLATHGGAPVSDRDFSNLLARFDDARAAAFQSLATSHSIEVGERDDRLEIRWRPESGRLEIRIRGEDSADGAGDGFQVKIGGKVRVLPSEEGGDLDLGVVADKPAVSLLPDKTLADLRDEVFGTWRDGQGRVWEIAAAAGGEGAPSGESPQQRIAAVEQEAKKIKSAKVFNWHNPETGETRRQDKFKRLAEPWAYKGEGYRDPGAEAKLEKLAAQIAELRAGSKPLPVDRHDPVGMTADKGEGEAARLKITVTDVKGYAFTYERASLTLGRITARRTLRDVRDIEGLPAEVVRQLVASWSPPEWIELEIRADPTTKQPYISGSRWRLHVTYSSDVGFEVKSIHTPYETALRLTQGKINVAEGAAEGEKP